jgi:hypothetical protein
VIQSAQIIVESRRLHQLRRLGLVPNVTRGSMSEMGILQQLELCLVFQGEEPSQIEKPRASKT